MKIRKFAQSTFIIENNAGKRVLIDPGIYNFTKEFNVEDFGSINILAITHKHTDHFDMHIVMSIVNLWNPVILTNPEISILLQNKNIGSRIGYTNDIFDLAGFSLTYIKTDHVIKNEVIVNFGLLIETDGKKIYYTSDTRYMEPELLNQEKIYRPDVLCIPISNRGIVMGIDDALYFTNQIVPKIVIPMHYDSPKDKDRVYPKHFAERLSVYASSLRHLSGIEIKVLSFGEQMYVK